jgi:hypothetical protein
MKFTEATKFHRKSGGEPRTALRSAMDREYTDFWVTEDHRWTNGLAGTGVGSPNDDPHPIDDA